jgi:hypothetical protein
VLVPASLLLSLYGDRVAILFLIFFCYALVTLSFWASMSAIRTAESGPPTGEVKSG